MPGRMNLAGLHTIQWETLVDADRYAGQLQKSRNKRAAHRGGTYKSKHLSSAIHCSSVRRGPHSGNVRNLLLPYLIRDYGDSSQGVSYRLVRQAYLNGAMNGEVDGWGFESRDITLI
jgi:hypothetical protein